MKLTDIQTAHYKPMLRAALEAGYPRHRKLDCSGLIKICTQRSAQLWREKIVPEIGPEQAAAFEKALWRVRMRAETSIPWPMAFGYAFGAACHALAGGDEAARDEPATTAALANFLIGLFDHLMDKYPREFGAVGSLMSEEALTRYILERDLSGLVQDPQQTLAAGFVSLYRLYFTRCHRLLGERKDSFLAHLWRDALLQMHAAQSASVGWRISTVPASPAMIEQSETPGTYSYWIIAMSACLGLNEGAIRLMEADARKYIRLTRLVDGVVDVEDDIKNDLWGGLAARLALEAKDQSHADQIVMQVADECVQLLGVLNGKLAQTYWRLGDAFSLADILWVLVWSWAGGNAASWIEDPVMIASAGAAP
jgi:hypothetical protein